MKTCIKFLGVIILGIILLSACKEETLPVKLVYPNDAIIGDGTKEEPYDVASAIRKAKKETVSWVKGYIVGAVKKNVTEITDANDIVWGSQEINNQTLLLASNAEENDYTKCLLIDLKGTNSNINNNLNLSENNEIIGKAATIYGKLTQSLLGINGIQNIAKATLEGADIPIIEEGNPLGLSMNTLSDVVANDFKDAVDGSIYQLKGWTNIPTQGLAYWKGCKKNSELFISITTEQIITNKKLESWFVTPAFNIIRGKSFTFDCLLENPSSNTLLEVYLWQESDGEMIAIPIGTESIKSTENEWKREIRFTIDEKYANTIGFIGFKFSTTTGENIQKCSIDNIQYGQQKILFTETFGNESIAIGTTIGVNAYKGYDNPDVFSASGGIADLRCLPDCFNGTNVLSCIYGWGGMAFEDEITMNVSSFIPKEGYGKLTLSFDVGAMDMSQPLNRMDFFCDDTPVTVDPSISVPLWTNIRVTLDLPLTSFEKIRLHFKGTGEGFGHCFDNITIIGE